MTKPTEKKEGWGTGHPKEPITKPTELEKIIRNLEVRHTISGNMIEGEEEVVEKLQTLIKEERKKAVEGFSKSFDALLKSFGTDEIFTTNPIRLEL